jgi:quercetin dioxygenase-like cupin family protein
MNISHMRSILTLVLLSTAISSCAQQIVTKRSDANNIFPKGNKINNANFNGTAYLQTLMEADSLNPTSVGNVTFEAGARTRWHKHPGGQILLVTEGVGYYQEQGQTKKILRKGDVIKCPSNVPHWHGASADSAFVQIAITNRHLGETVWLHEVTEEEYKR